MSPELKPYLCNGLCELKEAILNHTDVPPYTNDRCLQPPGVSCAACLGLTELSAGQPTTDPTVTE